MRKTILVLVLGLVLVFAVAGCGGGDDESSATTDETTTEETGGTTGEEADNELYASVGPGFEISLTTEDGEDVTSLAPGTYKVEVDDKSDQHNFHLSGPGRGREDRGQRDGQGRLGRRSGGRDVRVRAATRMRAR